MNQTTMSKTIQEATQVSLNAYNNIAYKEIEKESQERFRFLGQCLRTLTQHLERDESDRTQQ